MPRVALVVEAGRRGRSRGRGPEGPESREVPETVACFLEARCESPWRAEVGESVAFALAGRPGAGGGVQQAASRAYVPGPQVCISRGDPRTLATGRGLSRA